MLLGFLSILDRLSIRRNAEKSSEEIFSNGYLHPVAKFMDYHFLPAALFERLLKFFLHVIQRGLRVGGGLVLAVCFPDVPDDAVQIIVHNVAVKIAFLHLPQFQRPHIEFIFSGRILAEDGLPGCLQHQIHLLHPHIGDLVDADFHIYHQPPEIRVSRPVRREAGC